MNEPATVSLIVDEHIAATVLVGEGQHVEVKANTMTRGVEVYLMDERTGLYQLRDRHVLRPRA